MIGRVGHRNYALAEMKSLPHPWLRVPIRIFARFMRNTVAPTFKACPEPAEGSASGFMSKLRSTSGFSTGVRCAGLKVSATTALLVLVITIVGATLELDGQAPLVGISPTFYRDVLPVVQQHCQVCHRRGEIAPMPLMTYRQVRPYARAIERVTSQRIMPPWFADPRFGH